MSITRLEELTLNGWPALQTLARDGWLLRLANGYTRRANSVLPLYPGRQRLDEKIAAAEALYRARGQAVVFKLTAASQPAELDEALAARGYALEAPTSAQVLDLTTTALEAPATATCDEALTDEWLAAFCALSQVPERHHATMRQMLGSIVPAHAFFAVGPHPRAPITQPLPPWKRTTGEGEPYLAAPGHASAPEHDHPITLSPPHLVSSCGLAVVEDGYVGLADIVTHPAYRRQGHARRLILDALAWARARGAHTAYLQVMLDNAPALALYAGLGFEEVYRYWYRVKV